MAREGSKKVRHGKSVPPMSNGPMHCTRWPRRPCVAVITCPTGTRFTAAGINAPAGDAASRISAGWWNPEALTGSGFTFIRAPERCSFPPEVNIGSRPIEYVLGAMKSSCDSRSRGQVVRSKQPAYSLALPAVCMTIGRINQSLARWSVNYPGAFLNVRGPKEICPPCG